MPPETQKSATSPRFVHHIQRQLLKGLLLTSLGLAVIVAGFGFFYFQMNQSPGDRLVEANPGQSFAIMAVALWIWSLISIGLVHHLLAPILNELDRLEGTLLDSLQTGMVPTKLQSPSPIPTHRSPIFYAYWVLRERLASLATPQMQFLEMVSHELRSPLASILGYAALLTDPVTQPTAAAVERYAGVIVKQAQRMNQLVESIVTAAKVEEGRLELNRTPLRLRRLIEEVIEEARQQSKREILLEDNLSLSVCWGDQLRLREVFSNLIENALKYSGPETPIRVSLQPADVNRAVEITVQDQGIGIAEEELPILFTRFGRIRKPQTQGIPGHGLGLYIVKHIVESHGGSIAVRSYTEQGTAFIVRLPLSRD
jgi:signal transduction histidine kinase